MNASPIASLLAAHGGIAALAGLVWSAAIAGGDGEESAFPTVMILVGVLVAGGIVIANFESPAREAEMLSGGRKEERANTKMAYGTLPLTNPR